MTCITSPQKRDPDTNEFAQALMTMSLVTDRCR